MPIGLQLVAPLGREDILLGAMLAAEQALARPVLPVEPRGDAAAVAP